MPWFAVHVVLQAKTTPPTTAVHVWENIYLVEAADHGAARRAGLARGAEAAVGDFTQDGLPARWVVAGVRKSVECDDSEERPGHGTEVSYSQFQLGDEATLRRFLDEEPVALTYEE